MKNTDTNQWLLRDEEHPKFPTDPARTLVPPCWQPPVNNVGTRDCATILKVDKTIKGKLQTKKTATACRV
jgi:hypothetical protein